MFLAATALCLAQVSELRPSAVSWPELRQSFPQAWEFPELDARGLPLPSRGFEDRLSRVASGPLLETKDGPTVRLGDLIRAASVLEWDKDAMVALLDGYRPLLDGLTMATLEDLLLCDGIRAEDWKPSDDTRDGIVFGPTWELPEGYWLRHDGSRSVEQAATLILADLASVKRAEHDFPSYFTFPENSYLNVDPVPGTYLRHVRTDSEACKAAALDVRFRSDLPFPFTTYSLDLGILHRVRENEELITYVFGRGEDIHWLAGYDRFWTVRDREGTPVATLVVRQLALDISGVPDKSKHRREGIRSGRGNLRRKAEGIFQGTWSRNRDQDGAGKVPEFKVLGKRR